VEQRGIEPAPIVELAQTRVDSRRDQATRVDVTPRLQDGAGPNEPGVSEPMGSVEGALARALQLAAEAARWDVVSQLARELEARRLARDGDVVRLGLR